MDECIQDAIEIVDGARQHKCELEGKRDQLNNAISQVVYTSTCARTDIHAHFKQLKQKAIEAIDQRASELISEVNSVEEQSLGPLQDCVVLMQDGIEEASTVVSAGEDILNSDVQGDILLKQIKKFISSSNCTTLNSVPEIPSVTEVPSLAVIFNTSLLQELINGLSIEGSISQHAPVQISELYALPGAISAKWDESMNDSRSSDFDREMADQNTVFWLQSCVGRVPNTTQLPKTNERREKSKLNFKDQYVGSKHGFIVRDLLPNTIYTFRVCMSLDSQSDVKNRKWSPWSVYQEKMTTMPPLTWLCTQENKFYSVSSDKKVMTKLHKGEVALYSNASQHVVGYPLVFKIESEGKGRGKSDCICICTKVDPNSTCLHLKDGTFSLCIDGSVWINGNQAKLRFPTLHRGMKISIFINKGAPEMGKSCINKSKSCKDACYRVCISLHDQEGIFDWYPFKNSPYIHSLHFSSIFKYSGWKIAIL